MRVHTLAKEYGIKSTEFVDIIQDFGIDIKSHLSTLDDIQVVTIKQNMSDKLEQKLNLSPVAIETEEVQEALSTNIKFNDVEVDEQLNPVDEMEDGELSFGQKAFAKAMTSVEKEKGLARKDDADNSNKLTLQKTPAGGSLWTKKVKEQKVIVETTTGFWGWLKGLFT